MEGPCFQSRRITAKDPQTLSRQEEPACGDARLHLAYANCRQNGATGLDILLHETFERLGDPLDRMGRFKPEAVGEFSIGRGAPGLRLIDESLAETILQHVFATSLWASRVFNERLWRAQQEGDARHPADFADAHT